MRRYVGIVLVIIGIAYGVQGLIRPTGGNQRDNAAFGTSLIVAVICIAIGVTLLATKPRLTRRN